MNPLNIELYLKTVLGLDVKRASSNELVGKCPSGTHPDRTASWYINRESGGHQCKSCGFKGGIQFLSRFILGDNRSNSILKVLLGIDGHEDDHLLNRIKSISSDDPVPESIFDQSSYDYYINTLQDSSPLSESIGISIKSYLGSELIQKYGIKHWTKPGAYYNRIGIPIHDQAGGVVNINFRRISKLDHPKYSCLPAKACKSRLSDIIFFNQLTIDFMKTNSCKLPYLLITEGCFDSIKIGEDGFYSGSTFSNTISINQLGIIARITNVPIIIFDTDKQGLNGQNKSNVRSNDFMCFYDLVYPEYDKDPDEWDTNWLKGKVEELLDEI